MRSDVASDVVQRLCTRIQRLSPKVRRIARVMKLSLDPRVREQQAAAFLDPAQAAHLAVYARSSEEAAPSSREPDRVFRLIRNPAAAAVTGDVRPVRVGLRIVKPEIPGEPTT